MPSAVGVLMGLRALTGMGVLADMGVGSRCNRTGTTSSSGSGVF